MLTKNTFLSTTPVQKPKKMNSFWAKQMLETIETSLLPIPKPDVFRIAHNSCVDLDFNLEEEIDELMH